MNENCTQGNPFEWATCSGKWGSDWIDVGLSTWDEAMARQAKCLCDEWAARAEHIPHLSLVPPVDK